MLRNRLQSSQFIALLAAVAACPGLCAPPPVHKPIPAEAPVLDHTSAALSTKHISEKSTPLGNLAADAIRETTHADVAFIAAASFRDSSASIGPGDFSSSSLIKTLEFRSEKLAVLKLTGTQIQQAVKHSFTLYPDANSSFLQYSGLTLTINPKAEGEAAVLSIQVGNRPLSASRTYLVGMTQTLAGGALAYFRYWKDSDITQNLNTTLEQAITTYLQNHTQISGGEGRVIEKPS